MFKSLKSWFQKKPQDVQHVTTDNTRIPVSDIEHTRQELRKKLRDKSPISHQELQLAAKLFYQVDLPTSMWRLRRTQESLLYFRICAVIPNKGDDKSLVLRMCDDSLNTSLNLLIDVRDIPELMEPVPPIDLSRLQRRPNTHP